MVSFISSETLAIPGIRHAFFTRQGGVSSGLYTSLNGGLGSNDDPGSVQQNRRLMAAELSVAPENFLSCSQIHSADVVAVSTPWHGSTRPTADGMVTRHSGVALAISTADCGPVLFADNHSGVIGACHAGWKGALSGILDATIIGMEALGARRKNIKAVLGPTISQMSYEVGPEFVERFIDRDTAYQRFFIPSEKNGFSMFDLPGFIGYRFSMSEIGSFENLGLCTYRNEQLFFSYRRATHRKEGDYGRLIAAIAIKD